VIWLVLSGVLTFGAAGALLLSTAGLRGLVYFSAALLFIVFVMLIAVHGLSQLVGLK
jgi:hypothetical protein